MMVGGWFVTGTDTGVGKTCVSAALVGAIAATGRRVVGMKPVATGADRTLAGLRSDDAERLRAAGSVAVGYAMLNPYVFEPPVAPHLAAMQAGQGIDIKVIARCFEDLARIAEWVVVEGVGGWRVPIGTGRDTSDIARTLGLPVVLVVGARLGCINHALLTADAIRADGCTLAGWVANRLDPSLPHADTMIESLCDRIDAPLLSVIEHAPTPERWHAHGIALASGLLR